MKMEYCETVRAFDSTVTDFVTKTRVTLFFLMGTVILHGVTYLETKSVIGSSQLYQHAPSSPPPSSSGTTTTTTTTIASRDVKRRLAQHYVRFLCGPLLAVVGYLVLLFHFVVVNNDCSLNGVYIYLIGGPIYGLLAAVGHVRDWPRALFYNTEQYLTIFFYMVACTGEITLMPSHNNNNTAGYINNNTTVSPPALTVMVLANTGLLWVADYFHMVLLQKNAKLKDLRMFRLIYLYASVLRVMNVAIFFYQSAAQLGDDTTTTTWGGVLLRFLVSTVHAVVHYKAIRDVLSFDCESYYMSNQVRWAASVSAGAGAGADANGSNGNGGYHQQQQAAEGGRRSSEGGGRHNNAAFLMSDDDDDDATASTVSLTPSSSRSNSNSKSSQVRTTTINEIISNGGTVSSSMNGIGGSNPTRKRK